MLSLDLDLLDHVLNFEFCDGLLGSCVRDWSVDAYLST